MPPLRAARLAPRRRARRTHSGRTRTVREALGPLGTAVRKAAHRALAAVEEDIERLRFNRCVAHIYELANALQELLARCQGYRRSRACRRAFAEAGRIFVQILAPMMPHLAEECWQALGCDGLVAEDAWPAVDRSLLVEDAITLPVQVNGKKRADVTVARDADQAAIEAAVLSLEAVRRAMEGKPAAQDHRGAAEDRECRRLIVARSFAPARLQLGALCPVAVGLLPPALRARRRRASALDATLAAIEVDESTSAPTYERFEPLSAQRARLRPQRLRPPGAEALQARPRLHARTFDRRSSTRSIGPRPSATVHRRRDLHADHARRLEGAQRPAPRSSYASYDRYAQRSRPCAPRATPRSALAKVLAEQIRTRSRRGPRDAGPDAAMVAVKAGRRRRRSCGARIPASSSSSSMAPIPASINERARARGRKRSVDDPADPFQLIRIDGDVIAADPGRLADEAGDDRRCSGQRRAIWVRPTARNIAPAVEAVLQSAVAGHGRRHRGRRSRQDRPRCARSASDRHRALAAPLLRRRRRGSRRARRRDSEGRRPRGRPASRGPRSSRASAATASPPGASSPSSSSTLMARARSRSTTSTRS